jgi:hypothetical protein
MEQNFVTYSKFMITIFASYLTLYINMKLLKKWTLEIEKSHFLVLVVDKPLSGSAVNSVALGVPELSQS